MVHGLRIESQSQFRIAELSFSTSTCLLGLVGLILPGQGRTVVHRRVDIDGKAVSLGMGS